MSFLTGWRGFREPNWLTPLPQGLDFRLYRVNQTIWEVQRTPATWSLWRNIVKDWKKSVNHYRQESNNRTYIWHGIGDSITIANRRDKKLHTNHSTDWIKLHQQSPSAVTTNSGQHEAGSRNSNNTSQSSQRPLRAVIKNVAWKWMDNLCESRIWALTVATIIWFL